MNIFHVDFETYSEADLRSYGAYRYASDPSTEVLIFAIARNDEPPLVLDKLDTFGENSKVLALVKEALESKALIYAHNAQFEAAIFKYKFADKNTPALEQWRCTAAMARRAAIPSSLDGVGEFLKLDTTKDKEGKRLINKFSIPRKPTKKDTRTRILPQDDPEEFRKFGEYCRRDVIVEREAHKVLKAFELKGAVLESFQFDLEMNDRGVPVNVEALRRTDKLINEYTERMVKQFRELTGFNPTQRAKALEWLRERGYPFDNLQAANVDQVLENGRNGWECRYVEHVREVEGKIWMKENSRVPGQHDKPLPSRFKSPKLQPVEMTEEAFQALDIRSRVSYAAVKKVPTMLNMACPDGRCRGAMLWSGAERTHRWAGRVIQPQNFRRPTFKGTEQAYKMLCEGADIDTLEMLFAPFLEVVASCIRHFIQWPEGELLQADYSAVEARGNPWLCGAEKTLQLFRDEVPVYELMAAKIFHIPLEEVNGDQRFIGKQAILGCLAEGTLVLTNHGWKHIEKVETKDQLWDGIEWVDHKGLIYQGMKKTLNVSGLWLTPDHRILCGNNWKETQVVLKEHTLYQALAKGAENLPLPDSFRGSAAGAKRSLLNVLAAGLNMAFCSITLKGSCPPVAQFVPVKKVLPPVKSGGAMRTLSQMTILGKDYLTAYLPKSAVATTPETPTLNIMGNAEFRFVKNGEQTAGIFLGTVKRWLGGTTQNLKLTALTLMEITNPATFDLSRSRKMLQIKETLMKCKLRLTDSNRKTRTYDLLYAGPRHRFTVLTSKGPVIVHNCGYNMGRPKFRGTCENYNFTPPDNMVEDYKPRFRVALAKLRERCNDPEPFEKFEMKFPSPRFARLKNGKDGREFSVWAYRKGGVCRKIKDPDNPTAEEWLDLTYDDLADRAVTTWREDNPEIVRAWKDLDTAAKMAIQNPGKVFHGTDKISFGVSNKPGFRALVMRLPSGHSLIYPRPKLVWKGEEGVEKDPNDYYNIEIHFWGKVPMSSNWGWCKTYGGKLLENATQAVCGDMMANGAVNATKNKFCIIMLVHDEAIALKQEGQTQEQLCQALCQLPAWAEGMPLAAEGNVIPFYKKT